MAKREVQGEPIEIKIIVTVRSVAVVVAYHYTKGHEQRPKNDPETIKDRRIDCGCWLRKWDTQTITLPCFPLEAFSSACWWASTQHTVLSRHSQSQSNCRKTTFPPWGFRWLVAINGTLYRPGFYYSSYCSLRATLDVVAFRVRKRWYKNVCTKEYCVIGNSRSLLSFKSAL